MPWQPLGPERDVIPQKFINFQLTVPVTPQRTLIKQGATIAQAYAFDSMQISVHHLAGSSVYFGGANVIGGLLTNGLEIRPGIPIIQNIQNLRPLYELQSPLIDMACSHPLTIPLVVWDLDDCYLTADIEVSVAILLYQHPFR